MSLPAGWLSPLDSQEYQQLLVPLYASLVELGVTIPPTLDRNTVAGVLRELVVLHKTRSVGKAAIAMRDLINHEDDPSGEPDLKWMVMSPLKRSSNEHSFMIFYTIISFISAELEQMRKEGKAMMRAPVFFDTHLQQFIEAFQSAKRLSAEYHELPFNETEYATLATMILSEVMASASDEHRAAIVGACVENGIQLA